MLMTTPGDDDDVGDRLDDERAHDDIDVGDVDDIVCDLSRVYVHDDVGDD